MKYIIVIIIFIIIFLLYILLWKKTSKIMFLYKVTIRVFALFVVTYICISLFFIAYLDSSSNTLKKFYCGYVVDSETGKPIRNVKIFESTKNIQHISRTNINGYFKLKRSAKSINDLIFVKKGYKTDTVIVMKNRPIELNSIQYLFLSDDIDTLKMNIIK